MPLAGQVGHKTADRSPREVRGWLPPFLVSPSVGVLLWGLPHTIESFPPPSPLPSASPHGKIPPLQPPAAPPPRASLGFTPFSPKNGPNHLLSSSTPKQWLPSLINSTQHTAVRVILVRLRSDRVTPLLQTLPCSPSPLGESAESSSPVVGTLQSHTGRSRKRESGLCLIL